MLAPGDFLVEDLRVKAVLGGPGTSGEYEVYLVEQGDGQRLVAKTFQDKFGEVLGSMNLQLEEACLMAFNNHRNFVEYRGCARAGGRLYLLLEHVEGMSLEQRLLAGDYDIHDVVDWGIQIADALAFVQDRDCSHLDLSTNNIIVQPDNSIKLVDLSRIIIAKALFLFTDDPLAQFRAASAFGLMLLRMYNLSLLAELHGPRNSPSGDDEDSDDELREGWRHFADQHAQAMYHLGPAIQYLYSPDMSQERVDCKKPLKRQISRLLWSAPDRKTVNMREVESTLIEVHENMRRRVCCAGWLAEIEGGNKSSLTAVLVHKDTMTVLQEMADRAESRRLQDLTERGRQILEIASELALHALGESHVDHLELRTRLAMFHAQLNDFAAAESILRDVAELDAKTHGRMSSPYTISLNNLGSVLHRAGKLADARACFLESLGIKQKILRDGDASFGNSLSNLGRLCRDCGELEDAERWLLQALEIDKKAFGRDHARLREDLELLADVYRRMGRAAEAESLLA